MTSVNVILWTSTSPREADLRRSSSACHAMASPSLRPRRERTRPRTKTGRRAAGNSPVRVRCKEQPGGRLEGVLHLLHLAPSPRRSRPCHSEAVARIHATLLGRKVPDVAVACNDLDAAGKQQGPRQLPAETRRPGCAASRTSPSNAPCNPLLRGTARSSWLWWATQRGQPCGFCRPREVQGRTRQPLAWADFLAETGGCRDSELAT